MVLLLSLTLVQAPEKRVSVEVAGTLREAVEAFRQAGGGDVRIDVTASDAEGKRELRLKDVKPASALRWIAWLWNLELHPRDGVPVLSKGLGPDFVHRAYEVGALDSPPRDRPGPKLGLREPESAGLALLQDEPGRRAADLELLIDLIKVNVAPLSWDGPGTIERSIEGKLLVTHAPAVHAELAWFLNSLPAFAPTPVRVSVELREGPAEPAILPPDAVDAAAEAFRGGRRLQTSGFDAQRVNSVSTEKTTDIAGYVKGQPIRGAWVSEAGILDVRPVLVEGGRRISVELHLYRGRERALEAAPTPAGPLPLWSRAVARVETTFRIPNGGGAILALPGGLSCLLRATGKPVPRAPVRLSPPATPEDDLLRRLEAKADVEIKNAKISDLAAWLRRAGGLNVVVAPEVETWDVDVRGRDLPLAAILSLALKTNRLGVAARDEALVIERADRHHVRTAMIDVRDVADEIQDFRAPELDDPRPAYTGEDVANVIKNSLHKDRWEEADGKSIQHEDGVLFVRNAPEVLDAVAAFVEERRRHVPRQILVRADTVDLDREVADKLLGDVDLHDEAVLPKLLAGRVQERLGWICHEGQRTSVTWARGVDHLSDYDGEDPIRRAHTTRSRIDVRPHVVKDGIQLHLDYEDPRLLGFKDAKVRDLPIREPRTHAASAKSTLWLPPGKMAVLRWSPSSGPQRLLILRTSELK